MLEPLLSKYSDPLKSVDNIEDLVKVISSHLESEDFSSISDIFDHLRTPDRADLIDRLPSKHQVKLMKSLTPRDMGQIVGELGATEAIQLSRNIEPHQLSLILDETSPEVAVDVLRGLPVQERDETLSSMKDTFDVVTLMNYEDDDAGGLMTPEFMSLEEKMTVTEAINLIRHSMNEIDINEVSYILVVDHNRILKGGLNVSRLVTASGHQLISEVMHPSLITVDTKTDQEECAKLMERYNLMTLPVTNDDGILVGVVKMEDMINIFQEEATEDMYKMVGVDEGEKILGPFWKSVRGRLPWLCVNLATAGLAALVITLFQSTLSQLITLAVFLPVIAGQGGIVGTQTLTLVVRSLALGDINRSEARKLLIKELELGLVHGIILGAISGIVAYFWIGNEFLAIVVGVAMLANLVIAGISGVVLPLCLKAMKIDPALASAVVVTTVTDIVGFIIYLGLATLAISLIVG